MITVSYSFFFFTHDKRLSLNIAFKDFIEAARQLGEVVRKTRPMTVAKVITWEDISTYIHVRTLFADEEIVPALRQCKFYTLEQLTPSVWERSLRVEFFLRDKADAEFLICVSCDRYCDPKRMKFFGERVDPPTDKLISSELKKSGIFTKIGDGRTGSSSLDAKIDARISSRAGADPFRR